MAQQSLGDPVLSSAADRTGGGSILTINTGQAFSASVSTTALGITSSRSALAWIKAAPPARRSTASSLSCHRAQAKGLAGRWLPRAGPTGSQSLRPQ